MSSRRPPATLLATTVVLLTLAVAGGFTLDRAGIDALPWLDLRLLGLALGLALLAYERSRDVTGSRTRPRRCEGWLVAALLLFLLQVASGLWAPEGSRVGDQVLDVSVMGTLTAAFYLHARADPLVVARRTLWFFVVVGVVFGGAALAVTGPGAQGRFAAFGGGPNVFVRLQVLALIAVVALVWLGASRLLLAAVPLFAVTALLSGSRGGLLAAGVVAVLVVALGGATARRLAVPATLALGLVLAVAAAVSPPVADLVQTRFVDQTGSQVYTSGRPEIWGSALSVALEHPLLGAGLDGYYGLVGSAQGIQHPHNYVLAVAAEAGLVGLVLLGVAVTLWVRVVRRGNWKVIEAQVMIISASYVATASLFSGHYYDARLAWMFVAVAAAVAVAGEQSVIPDDVSPRSRAHPFGPSRR